MATETKILGKQDFLPKKKIEFECYLNNVPVNGKLDTDAFLSARNLHTPEEFDVVVLICLNYACGKDIMMAYDKDKNMSEGYLFVGKWNDGVV